MSIVTFTTDFGWADGYVGAMKGVVLSRARGVTLVDICHEVPPQDVAAGAFALAQAAPHFPPGTVHVAVVDPGVGGARAEVIVLAKNHLFVGPDNGLLTLVAPRPDAIFAIESPAFRRHPVSPTFHGRDVFAPAAGLLAAGVPPEEAGRMMSTLAPLANAVGAEADGHAHVVHVDHYGNVVTSLRQEALPPGARSVRMFVTRDEGPLPLQLPVRKTFADVEPDAALVYVGSAGLFEIAVRNGSAAARFGLRRGVNLSIEVIDR